MGTCRHEALFDLARLLAEHFVDEWIAQSDSLDNMRKWHVNDCLDEHLHLEIRGTDKRSEA